MRQSGVVGPNDRKTSEAMPMHFLGKIEMGFQTPTPGRQAPDVERGGRRMPIDNMTTARQLARLCRSR
jgi:hypothetical protein